ncbi:MAG: IclR family transcriptional regulator [Proteobacteria bacterium]|nr:IclR family transcriptional regulator [Pseudomonadota bacterium]
MPKTRDTHARIESQNRSLERGLDILKAFRPGSDLMGNSDIAERTGLARSTVSRLTQTLMNAGMLDYDRSARAYRLGAANLSLALGVRLGNPALQAATPLMRAASEKLHVNVGLATADGEDMVYLESIRYNRKVVLRTVLSGQRVPIDQTSLGRAYLAALPGHLREEFLAKVQSRGTARAKALEQHIRDGVRSVEDNGYCAASWQPEVVALAAPLILPDMPIYALNMSLATNEPFLEVVDSLKAPPS